MRIEVYPYGPDIQRHYEELRAAGTPDSEASEASRSIWVDWPDGFRLPVVGDDLSVGWASGPVSSVWFGEEDGKWYIRVHLGPRVSRDAANRLGEALGGG